MATKTKQPELLTIGELCKKHNIKRAVFAGRVCRERMEARKSDV